MASTGARRVDDLVAPRSIARPKRAAAWSDQLVGDGRRPGTGPRVRSSAERPPRPARRGPSGSSRRGKDDAITKRCICRPGTARTDDACRWRPGLQEVLRPLLQLAASADLSRRSARAVLFVTNPRSLFGAEHARASGIAEASPDRHHRGGQLTLGRAVGVGSWLRSMWSRGHRGPGVTRSAVGPNSAAAYHPAADVAQKRPVAGRTRSAPRGACEPRPAHRPVRPLDRRRRSSRPGRSGQSARRLVRHRRAPQVTSPAPAVPASASTKARTALSSARGAPQPASSSSRC